MQPDHKASVLGVSRYDSIKTTESQESLRLSNPMISDGSKFRSVGCDSNSSLICKSREPSTNHTRSPVHRADIGKGLALLDTFFNVKIKKAKVIAFWKVVQNTKRTRPRPNTLFHSKTASNYRDSPAFPNPSLYQAARKGQAKIVISMDETERANRPTTRPASFVQQAAQQVIHQSKKPAPSKGSSITITLFDSLHDSAQLAKTTVPRFLKTTKPVLVAADSPVRPDKKERFDRESLDLEHNIYTASRGCQERTKLKPQLAGTDLKHRPNHFIDFEALDGVKGKTTFN